MLAASAAFEVQWCILAHGNLKEFKVMKAHV